MKIYYHPVSTTSRPVLLFCLENKIDAEFAVVDLMTGEHKQPAFLDKNPTGLVPVLEDGSFRMSESSTILKYLAEKTNSPAYPKDLQARAKVNEMMDWTNTQLCRDMIEESMTRKAARPRTRASESTTAIASSASPMRQVPQG